MKLYHLSVWQRLRYTLLVWNKVVLDNKDRPKMLKLERRVRRLTYLLESINNKPINRTIIQ